MYWRLDADVQIAGHIATGINGQVVGDRRAGFRAQSVFGDFTGHLAGAMVLIQQERGVDVEIIFGIELAERNRVLLAVAEEAGERCEVNAIGNEIESLDSWNWRPEKRIDSAGVNPWIDGRDAGGRAVDSYLRFAEGGVAAKAQEF